jgi:hypothetical protein
MVNDVGSARPREAKMRVPSHFTIRPIGSRQSDIKICGGSACLEDRPENSVSVAFEIKNFRLSHHTFSSNNVPISPRFCSA